MTDKKLTRGVSAGALALPALFAAGCGHLPVAPPAFEAMATQRAGIPADWTIAQMTGDSTAVIADYSVFNDPRLTTYIQEALENNRTLRAAMESIVQSQAALRQTRSGLWPSLRASAGVSSSSPVDNFNLDNEVYTFGITGAYSVDIMGDLNTSIQASVAGLRSTEATYELARRNLAAQVARAYFTMIEAQLQLDLDRRTLARQQDTYRITNTRFEAGSVARDDLVLGQANLASTETSIIAGEQQLRSSVRALEVLLGRFPQNKLETAGALPDAPALPPLGLPELTIRARPDVVAAELNMIQTFADARIQRLAPWPQFDASLGLVLDNTTINSTDDLFDFDDLAFRIGLSIAQVIFDGGAISGRIEAADSRQRAALQRYGQTIIDSYAEIVSAIDQFNTLNAQQVSLQANASATNEVLRLNDLKYQEGSASLFDLIQFRERADSADSQVIANRRARLEQWIVLHRVLGGNPTKAQPLPSAANTANGQPK